MMKPESSSEGSSSSSSTHEPKYKGVRKRKWGKWVSEIRLPNSRERIWLGSYDSAEKAARAFDAAAFCLRGPAANFNFPDQPPNISGGRSLSSAQIQAAAARFANSVPDETLPMQESTSSLVILHDNNSSNNNNVTDYDIFPGFDDYFMQPPPIVAPQFPEYDDQGNSSDGDISQGPSFLWNY